MVNVAPGIVDMLSRWIVPLIINEWQLIGCNELSKRHGTGLQALPDAPSRGKSGSNFRLAIRIYT